MDKKTGGFVALGLIFDLILVALIHFFKISSAETLLVTVSITCLFSIMVLKLGKRT
ncbi:MAG: hypothetical protein JSV20_03560 [Candidatus Bathyarchaeota archaeon]|nr:MAG: hypothetical protein JSV20_03560 [Candidatus Bathyarchaeota archaeon]